MRMLGKQSESSKEHTVFLTPGLFVKLRGLVSFIGVIYKNVGEGLLMEAERIQRQLPRSKSHSIANEDGTLGITTVPCSSSLLGSVSMKAHNTSSRSLAGVFWSRKLDWCLFHG